MATVAARPPHTLPHAALTRSWPRTPAMVSKPLCESRGTCGCWYHIRDLVEITILIGYGSGLPPVALNHAGRRSRTVASRAPESTGASLFRCLRCGLPGDRVSPCMRVACEYVCRFRSGQ